MMGSPSTIKKKSRLAVEPDRSPASTGPTTPLTDTFKQASSAPAKTQSLEPIPAKDLLTASPIFDIPPESPSGSEVPATGVPTAQGGEAPLARSRELPSQVERRPHQKAVVILSLAEPNTPLGEYVAREAVWLAQRGLQVHLYCGQPPVQLGSDVIVRQLRTEGADPLKKAEQFSRQATHAFHSIWGTEATDVAIIGHEWTAVPALMDLAEYRTGPKLLSLHSLESQRSDMSSGLSERIQEVELEGLKKADRILVQDHSTWEIAEKLSPGSANRMMHARRPFPIEEYVSHLDPGAVKARYQVGPIDPTILFVGDMDDRHGPDILIKAMPAVLKNHPQARLIYVGEGPLLWPVRVQSRYMLLDHAVRVLGHVGGQEVRELIAAVDMIIVPSRVTTEDWQILSGWAASKPVIATHEVGAALCRHEQDAVLIYPHPPSCVWGIERVLYDSNLAQRLAGNGHKTVVKRFGPSTVAAQIEGALFPTRSSADSGLQSATV